MAWDYLQKCLSKTMVLFWKSEESAPTMQHCSKLAALIRITVFDIASGIILHHMGVLENISTIPANQIAESTSAVGNYI